jgi:sugar (pentulose or hexulose) kinase
MRRDILAIDVGTSGLKLGVFGPDLEERVVATRDYAINLYDRDKADVAPETWWAAIRSACAEVAQHLDQVGILSLSVTTPALTPMAADGSALGPAILFLDGRSRGQAAAIREAVGEERFLAEACNLPVSGGSSLASILWIREHQPETWAATTMFGHCNTYLTRRLTGRWAIDPSTTSITGLYATARHDLTWNADVLAAAGLSPEQLPPLMQSYDPVGPILPEVARELGLPRDVVVLCGGNDATLAAFSGGLTDPGDVNIISGTCDIANVCTDRPVSSREFNVRAHILPRRWLTFFVLNTGGAALEWFREQFCRELDESAFYGSYLPSVLRDFFASPDIDEREASLPAYRPYLSGSRYSLEPLTGAFDGMTLLTTREDFLLSLVRGNLRYLGEHLELVARLVPMNRRVGISGGAARIGAMLDARRRWTGDLDYFYQDQSSMLGAAMLGQIYQDGLAALEQPGPLAASVGTPDRQAQMTAERT